MPANFRAKAHIDREKYLAMYKRSIESPDAIATRVLNQLFYDLPLEDLPAYPERVRSVTPDDIQRVAKAWLRPAQLSVVLVGDAAKFLPQLAAAGFTTVERVPIEEWLID